MKKCIFSLLAVLCFAAVSVSAQQLTSEQRRAKSEIFTALQRIATDVSHYDDESISFHYRGTSFFVTVSSRDTNPLYICLESGYDMPEGYDVDLVRIAATDAAADMPVFVFSEEGLLVFDCEMYVKDSSPFIAVLPDMLNALLRSWDNFPDAYQEALKDYVPKDVTSSTGRAQEGIYIFPKVNNTDDSRLFITKATLDSHNTILDMTTYNGGRWQWCSISKGSYIMANGRRYTLERAEGIAYAPQYTYYPNHQSGRDVCLSFRLYFPPLPEGTTLFSFSEGDDGWHLGDVELKHGNSFSVSGTTVETSYHSWKCVSVEVQSGQTIVTKVVTPKSSDTYVFSSQGECIEDADTGRKYYLQESSIGFEGAPTELHSTSPVTFYELYPALPSNVKTINIWSGSSYYVKNLKIR